MFTGEGERSEEEEEMTLKSPSDNQLTRIDGVVNGSTIRTKDRGRPSVRPSSANSFPFSSAWPIDRFLRQTFLSNRWTLAKPSPNLKRTNFNRLDFVTSMNIFTSITKSSSMPQ